MENSKPWGVVRIICVILVAPFVIVFALILSLVAIIYGLSALVSWVFATAIGEEYE